MSEEMKKIDIEKLEKTTPYEVSDDFFDSMQQQVFSRIAPLQENQKKKDYFLSLANSFRAIRNKAYFAMAAVLLLSFGIVALGDFTSSDASSNPYLAKTQASASDSLQALAQQSEKDFVESQPSELPKKEENKTVLKSSFVENKQKFSREREKIEKNNAIEISPKTNSEQKIQLAVEKLSKEELADLSHQYQQDTYLELY